MPPNACPHCGHSLTRGENTCVSCGGDLSDNRYEHEMPAVQPAEQRAEVKPPLGPRKHRGLLWLAFWLLFLGTPLSPLLGNVVGRFMPFRSALVTPMLAMALSVLGGTLGAGFVLAKLYSRTTAQFVVRGFLFGLGIAIFYAAVFFAGCMIVLSK